MDFLCRADSGQLEPFILVIEGSIPNEDNKEEGYWAALGTDKQTGQPVTTCEWIDRLASKAWAVVAIGTCAAYGGIHAMQGNPTGARGLPDYLGREWQSKAGIPIVCIPGCPTMPDNMTETLLYLLYQSAGRSPTIPLDEALRPTWLFSETVHEGCDRGGYYEQAHKNMLEETALTSISAFALLGLGLVFGLKHATEADHIVAVSTIVSEQRSLLRSALVGGLWGVGHTLSLIVVGIIVLSLRVAVPETVAHWLEFVVALMIIGLGANALLRGARRRRSDVHLHQHNHDGLSHVHIHFHERETKHKGPVTTHSHAVSSIGFKPLLVGAMHGLAGSAALTLLVLTQIDSTALGLLYLAVFGVGSIAGMLLMSGLIGLPFALSARRFSGVHYGLQTVAGALSIVFGLWYAYRTGIASGLWRTLL
jgi:ABC-type nickel/cobalt efflux system permease component RcnA